MRPTSRRRLSGPWLGPGSFQSLRPKPPCATSMSIRTLPIQWSYRSEPTLREVGTLLRPGVRLDWSTVRLRLRPRPNAEPPNGSGSRHGRSQLDQYRAGDIDNRCPPHLDLPVACSRQRSVAVQPEHRLEPLIV